MNLPMNQFADTRVVAKPTNAIASAEEQRAVAEVKAALQIAKMFPRDQMQALDRIVQACSRHSLAESALYSYGRGGSDVSGPSIRLAEAIAQEWGNVQFGIRELSQANGESTVEAYAWDVETNTRSVKVFQVPHIRYTRAGSKKLEDPRDIYELVANNGSRRLRACILAVIPGDVVETATKQCESTLEAKADTSPDAVNKMIEAFKVFGVTKDMVQKRIGRRLDAITPAQVVQMRKVYNSLKDGMSSPSEWFDMTGVVQEDKPVSATASIKEKLKQKEQAAVEEKAPDNETGEIKEPVFIELQYDGEKPRWAGFAADFTTAIEQTETLDDLEELKANHSVQLGGYAQHNAIGAKDLQKAVDKRIAEINAARG